MEKLNKKNRILIGLTLFSMFFGAGNLIFPTFLGAQAGKETLWAFGGFAVSAVVLPILGVIAVTKSGGLENLTSRVHPKFTYFFAIILYLAIGPCLAIPRTASTSFSIAVLPFWDKPELLWAAQLIYSAVFFMIATLVAMHPERLTEYLGKRLTPILLILIVTIFTASLLRPAGNAAEPTAVYTKLPGLVGLLDGYQTLDMLAALNFGMIVALNIRTKGIKSESAVIKETVLAGFTAGAVLFVVYGMLSYIGMVSSRTFACSANGTEILTQMMQFLFGSMGSVILAVLFVIACFNTCVSLISCCAKYFQELFPILSYRVWVCLFAFLSMIISNVGLNVILRFSVPMLNAIYPMAIVLIFLACIHHKIKRYPAIYPCAVFFCGVSSLVSVLDGEGIVFWGVTHLMRHMPGYAPGFGWILPAVFGIADGAVGSLLKNKLSAHGR